MGIEHLYRNATLPPMARVRRQFAVDSIPDIEATLLRSMERANLAAQLKAGDEVAIGVGSRGIAHLPRMVATVVAWFRRHGAKPFVFPAIGSHGGATGPGQVRQLAALGVTEAAIGCNIRSDMETVILGQLETDAGISLDVHFDQNAHRADRVFFLSRIKPHPGFVAEHESGICKMLSIGCGKHAAAETCHRLGYTHFPNIIAGMANMVLEQMPRIIGALAIVENALHDTALLECVPRENLIERDTEILKYARTCLPDLPVRSLHALVVDYMGKDIAGPGMDPNITGRFLTDRRGDIEVGGLTVLNLTEGAHGNANGMGAADYLTRRLYGQIDFEATYLNGLTDPATTLDVSLPPVMPNDLGAISMALLKGNTFAAKPRVVRIRDTLNLDRLLVSPAVLEEITGRTEFTVLTQPEPIAFDREGNLADQYQIWQEF